MKKQIFILVIAIFASVATAFGQAVPGTPAVPLICAANDPLNPIAGRPYDYIATINPANGTAFWYATNSTIFTTAGARVATIIPNGGAGAKLNADAATPYATAIPNATDPTKVTVTWTSAGLAGIDKTINPLFMVVEYTGPTCANNLKVMQIIPKIAFTVDITNVAHAAPNASLAYGLAENQCFDLVQDAKFDLAAGNVIIDYGTNVLYFEVIGANFTGSYLPTLKLTGLLGTQTAAIDWGYVKGTYDQPLVADQAGVGGITSPQFTVSTTVPATDKGVSIYVRVTVKNHGFEGLADEAVTLAVEAIDNTPQANKDVDPDCVTFTDYGDLAVQTLNLRPTVAPGTPMMPQVP